MASESLPLVKLEELRRLCEVQDDRKNELIKGLFSTLRSQTGALSDANAELLDKKQVVKGLREEIATLELCKQGLEQEKDKSGFALVLVDGDHMLFRDELLKEGVEGGKKASRLLKQAVEQELRGWAPEQASHLQVVVRVYANVRGLGNAYQRAGVTGAGKFSDFVRGFNMGVAMCDYIDAGDKKECADVKVNATFKLHLENVHCRKVLFGGAADGGYAHLLGPLIVDEAVRDRVALIHGPPFVREMAALQGNFRCVSFEALFKNTNVISQPVMTPPATPAPNYATAAAQGVSIPTTSAQHPEPSARMVLTEVYRNQHGQRVDPPLAYSQYEYNRLSNMKLCRSYHVLGRCKYTQRYGDCRHEHDTTHQLSPGYRSALRALARSTPCHTGLGCGDRDCLSGHRCPRDNCPGGGACGLGFPASMHQVDRNVVV